MATDSGHLPPGSLPPLRPARALAGSHPGLAAAALLATLLAGSALGAALLLAVHGALGVVPEAWVQLHAHLQLFAFVSPLVLGVSAFLLPRFWGSPAAPPAAVRAAAALLFAGVALTSLGLLDPSRRLARVAFPAAAALEVGGVGLGSLLVLRARRGAGRRRPALDAWVLAGTAWWLAGTLLQAWNAASSARAGRAALSAALAEPTYAALLYGFAGGWIVGVGLRVRVGPRPGRVGRAAWAWNLGVALLVAVPLLPLGGALARSASGLGHALLGAAGLLLVAEPAVLVGMRRHDVARERRRERVVRAAWAFLALHSLLALAVGAAGLAGRTPHALVLDSLRHVFTLGVLATMVLGMGTRLFPQLTGRAIPRLGLVEGAAALVAAGVLLRLLAVPAALGTPRLLHASALSGAVALAGLATGFGTLLATLLGRPGPEAAR